MKYLKYTLLLIILLTFVSVHAETCTYEEKQKLAENIDLSKLKLTYVKGNKKSGGYIKAEMILSDDYSATLTDDGYKQKITNNYYAFIDGGKQEIEIFSIQCEDTIFKTELLLPHYNSKNEDVFDDGSKSNQINMKNILLACNFILLLATIVLIRRSIKNENIS